MSKLKNEGNKYSNIPYDDIEEVLQENEIINPNVDIDKLTKYQATNIVEVEVEAILKDSYAKAKRNKRNFDNEPYNNSDDNAIEVNYAINKLLAEISRLSNQMAVIQKSLSNIELEIQSINNDTERINNSAKDLKSYIYTTL